MSEVKPYAFTVAEACALARVGRTTLYAAISAGDLRAVKLGRRTLVLERDLRAWIEGLPELARKPAQPADRGGQAS